MPYFSFGAKVLGASFSRALGLVLASILPFVLAAFIEELVRAGGMFSFLDLLNRPFSSGNGGTSGSGVSANVSVVAFNIESVEDAVSALVWTVAYSLVGAGIVKAIHDDKSLNLATPIRAIRLAPRFCLAVIITWLLFLLPLSIIVAAVFVNTNLADVVPSLAKGALVLGAVAGGILGLSFCLRMSILPAYAAIEGKVRFREARAVTRGEGPRFFTNFVIWSVVLVVIGSLLSLLGTLPLSFLQYSLQSKDVAPEISAIPGAIFRLGNLGYAAFVYGSLAIFSAMAYAELSQSRQESE